HHARVRQPPPAARQVCVGDDGDASRQPTWNGVPTRSAVRDGFIEAASRTAYTYQPGASVRAPNTTRDGQYARTAPDARATRPGAGPLAASAAAIAPRSLS